MTNKKLKDALQHFVRENIFKGDAGFGLKQQDSCTRGGHAATGNPSYHQLEKLKSSTTEPAQSSLRVAH